MYVLLILFFLSIIETLIIVKINPNSLYSPRSPCSFIRNATLSNDASTQSCIWECVHEFNCQTAVFYNNEKICSLFDELHSDDQIQPSGNIQADVICYKKSHSKLILF